MSLELNTHQHHREYPDKYVNPNANYQMSVRDYVMRPFTQGAGPITITLPPVSEARGRWYSIICRNASGVNTVTVQDRDDSECWPGDLTMNAKCDKALYYSDGLAWHAFNNQMPWATTTGPPGTATATTAAPTTATTTAAPTTLATTAAPTTAGQGTTAAPTTVAATTAAPTTLATTAAPTTAG